MKRTVESKKSEMMNRKKGKELLEVYEWNNMIGELYDSICEMVNREKSKGSESKWLVLKEYSKLSLIHISEPTRP